METLDAIKLLNYIFLYVFYRYCHGKKGEMANLLQVSKSEVTGWLTQMEEGSASYIATGKVMLVCEHKQWSLDEILASHKASELATKYAHCPFVRAALDKHEIVIGRIRSSSGLDKDERELLAKHMEMLLMCMMEVFCGDDHNPGLCKRKYDMRTKKKQCSFEECPCNIICKAWETVMSLLMD